MLWSPTDIADSFDFRDGEASNEPPTEVDGVNNPALDEVDAADKVADPDVANDLATLLVLDEKLDGGDFGRKNCLG